MSHTDLTLNPGDSASIMLIAGSIIPGTEAIVFIKVDSIADQPTLRVSWDAVGKKYTVEEIATKENEDAISQNIT